MTATSRAMILSELSAGEAREIFDRFVAGEPERLATFLAEVRRRNGPVERLDRSLESMVAGIWKRRARGSHARQP